MSNVATGAISNPTIEVVKGWNTRQLNDFLKARLKNIENIDTYINIITETQKVDGGSFLVSTALAFERWGIPGGPALKIEGLIKEIREVQYIQENMFLKYENFLLKLGNTQNSASVYRFVRKKGVFKIWEIEDDPNIIPQRRIGQDVFNKHPVTPAQGSNGSNESFCKNVVSEINGSVNSMKSATLRVYGDVGIRAKDQIYADIIIGSIDFHKELTDNPPDLSRGLGWEVKNNLSEGSRASEGKGRLIKYARAYLSANSCLTNVFYGCLTDGKIWQFVKITFMLEDIDDLKVKFEESHTYEWSIKTASLIAGIICRYHDDLSMRGADEKKESQNKYMYRNMPSISTKSLLASFIEEGIYIRLRSGNRIHVQITSHLGNGKGCIVFLAQVRDYGIKDAVLKIEVSTGEIPQAYREISALYGLGDLPCVPTILLEGYTMGGSLALLTDFAGQPLESWISDNGNIDDHTIFQIVLDLLSCLEKIHACGYTHGDVAIRNVIQRNGHFYLIDFGLATLLQLLIYPCQAIIQDYIDLCQIIGIIKFGEKMSVSELIGKLKGELKSLVVFVENASKWNITDEGKWLEKFGVIVKQSYEIV